MRHSLILSNSKQFTVADVAKFVEQSGSIAAHFRFFDIFAANSEFYLLVTKPLFSLGSGPWIPLM
jgi:hypothetical protein